MQFSKEQAYTSPRPDVAAMVPVSARTILDVGCSNGALGRGLKQSVSGRKVTGIEKAEALCAEADTCLDVVVRADLESFQWDRVFGEACFDAIIFADVLEHLVEPQRHLRAAAEHLSEEGRIIVSLPNIRHLSSFVSIFVVGTFPQRERGIFDRTHVRWFTFNDAKRLLEESGFVVSDVHCNLRWGDQGGGILNKILGRLPASLCKFPPVREFLTYQFCFSAVPRRGRAT